jgi:formate hydrogenlyase subunit 3/multisubunit Na+/H+ antiporter MnhD subunit
MDEPNTSAPQTQPQTAAQPHTPSSQEASSRNASSRKSWSVLGTAALIAALFGILAAAVWLAVRTWVSAEGAPIPPVGYAAMAVGVVFSLLVGFALMALVFYSSRYGYDERAAQEFHSGDEDDN